MENKTILVIEDDAFSMKLVTSLLEIGNFNILEALDAETGIRLALEYRPDLILMDIQLPGMDGLNATRSIKYEPALNNTPIVALTANAMVGDKEKAIEAGCTGYISKPIDVKAFLDNLSRFFEYDEKDSSNDAITEH